MNRFHWLIVVPYYFFLALTLLPLLMVVARLVRWRASLNALASVTFVLALLGVVVPLAAGWIDLAHLTGGPLIALVVMSFGLVALDGLLARHLRAPLDDDLEAL